MEAGCTCITSRATRFNFKFLAAILFKRLYEHRYASYGFRYAVALFIISDVFVAVMILSLIRKRWADLGGQK